MSKYGVFETNFRDGRLLAACLRSKGFVVEEHGMPKTLLDFCGNPRPEKAHLIIRRNHTGIDASNDIGFLRGADGNYQAIISEYDREVKFGDQWLGKLKQGYTEQRHMQVARSKGYVFEGRRVVQTDKGEQVKLLFQTR